MPEIAFDLRYLRYAILVAQHGSFSKAGESLNLSHTTVNRRVGLLERVLGVPLFDRDHTGVRLTPAGQRFIQDATVGANLLSDAIRDLREFHRASDGVIRVGLMSSLADGFLADLLRDFRTRYPEAEIKVEEMSSDCAKIGLLCNRVDVAFLPNVAEVPGCKAVGLWEEQVLCALPKGHQHRWLARQHPAEPCARPGSGMDMSFDDHAIGPDDQQPPQRTFAHLRRGPEPLLAPGGMLPWHEAKPGGKVA